MLFTNLFVIVLIAIVMSSMKVWPDITTMNVTNSQNAANTFVPKIWLDEVLATKEANLVIASSFRRINHNGKPGDTLTIPFISDLSTTTKTVDVAVIPSRNAEGLKAITLDKHEYVAYLIDDFLKVQSKYDLRSEYAKKGGYAEAKKIDTDLGAAIVAGLNAAYKVIGSDGTTQYSANNYADLTDAGIRAAIKKLDDNDVPEEGRFLLIPPSQKSAMLGIDKFCLFQNTGRSQELTKGTFGQIYGLTVKVSTNMPDVGTAGKYCFLGHRDAAVTAVQIEPRLQAQYKLEYLGWLMVHDMVYGVKVLRGDAADTTASNYRKSHCVALAVPA